MIPLFTHSDQSISDVSIFSNIGFFVSLRSSSMNPLCCIAPVLIEKDPSNNPSSVLKSPLSNVNRNNGIGSIKQVYSAQVSSVGTDYDFPPPNTIDHDDLARLRRGDHSCIGNGDNNNSVAGILYKWVNYGKGWRSRWFMLEDGVLSYYKIHGPHKIAMGSAGEKGAKVIGQESMRYMRKAGSFTNGALRSSSSKGWKPLGEIHLKVSSIRASKSDDKRLSIFSGTKTLHLRCVSREYRAKWIEALLSAKDLFPRILTSSDFAPSEDIVVSTEKLRSRLLQEGLSEAVVGDCESIMLSELSELQNQLKGLQRKHIALLDTLRQLETEKVELETTVVDETKGRKSYCGPANGRLSVNSVKDSESSTVCADTCSTFSRTCNTRKHQLRSGYAPFALKSSPSWR